MTTRQSFFDRLAVFLTGLLLLLAGLAPAGLYFTVPYASDWLGSLNRSTWSSLVSAGWYPWALGALAVVSGIVGLSMIVTNVLGRGFTRREFDHDDEGNTVVHFGRLATAMGTYMTDGETVTGVDSTVSMVKNTPTITFTIHATPYAGYNELIALVESVDRDFRDAVEDMELATVYKLHLNRVDS